MNDPSLQDVYTLQIRRQVNPEGASPYCEACKNGFLHVNSLQVRQFTQTGKLPGVCKSCNSAFMRICRLQIRHLTQTEPQPHACTICGKTFTHAGNFRKHILLHTKQQEGKRLTNGGIAIPKPPFNCDKCGRNFLKYGSFQKHYQAHDIVQTFVCDICDKVFKSKAQLKAHLKTHKLTQPSHSCKLCKAWFHIPEELEEHLLQHVDDQFKNTNQTQTDPNNAEPSANSHGGRSRKTSSKLPKKRTKSAKIISVKFSSKRVSKKFAKRGRKPKSEQPSGSKVVSYERKIKHSCSVCQKGFVSLGALKKHFLLHTGSLSYKCKNCSIEFLHASDLKKHAKVHQFSCKNCKKDFKTLRLLRSHSATHKKK